MKTTILLILLFTLSSCGFSTIGTGKIGVKTQFGKILETNLSEGIHFYVPFTGISIDEVDMRVFKFANTEPTFTKDNQEIKVTFAVTFKLDKSQIEYIFRNGNEFYFSQVGPQIIAGVMKEVVGQYDAETIVSKRQQVNNDIQKAIALKLAASYIIVDNFEVTNFEFDKKYQQAIEDKMIATQKAKEAENKTSQVREEKNQQILAAQGQAEAMRIKSAALSQNKNLIEYEIVQKWNGILPVTMLGSTLPFLNIGSIHK